MALSPEALEFIHAEANDALEGFRDELEDVAF
jgi:hypothetical protein